MVMGNHKQSPSFPARLTPNETLAGWRLSSSDSFIIPSVLGLGEHISRPRVRYLAMAEVLSTTCCGSRRCMPSSHWPVCFRIISSGKSPHTGHVTGRQPQTSPSISDEARRDETIMNKRFIQAKQHQARNIVIGRRQNVNAIDTQPCA